jgi:hypothetical protein
MMELWNVTIHSDVKIKDPCTKQHRVESFHTIIIDAPSGSEAKEKAQHWFETNGPWTKNENPALRQNTPFIREVSSVSVPALLIYGKHLISTSTELPDSRVPPDPPKPLILR